MVGGIVPKWNTNIRKGFGKLFIYEACENFKTLVHWHPDYLVVTSIDDDHLDIYGSLDEVRDVFFKYINRIANNNLAIVNLADVIRGDGLPILKGNVKFYCSEQVAQSSLAIATWGGLTETFEGSSFIYTYKNKRYIVNTPLRGSHNMDNITASLTVCAEILGSDYIPTFVQKMSIFQNVKARFEQIGVAISGAKVFLDYAHHPTEITGTLRVARAMADKNNGQLVVVYQPHLFSRTFLLADRISESLKVADKVYLLPIYACREPDQVHISSSLITKRLIADGKYVEDVKLPDSIIEEFIHCAKKPDILVLVGAGDIDTMARRSFSVPMKITLNN